MDSIESLNLDVKRIIYEIAIDDGNYLALRALNKETSFASSELFPKTHSDVTEAELKKYVEKYKPHLYSYYSTFFHLKSGETKITTINSIALDIAVQNAVENDEYIIARSYHISHPVLAKDEEGLIYLAESEGIYDEIVFALTDSVIIENHATIPYTIEIVGTEAGYPSINDTTIYSCDLNSLYWCLSRRKKFMLADSQYAVKETLKVLESIYNRYHKYSKHLIELFAFHYYLYTNIIIMNIPIGYTQPLEVIAIIGKDDIDKVPVDIKIGGYDENDDISGAKILKESDPVVEEYRTRIEVMYSKLHNRISKL